MDLVKDYDDLTTTQQLILETLAARWRLGEEGWTFSTQITKQLRQLETEGYVDWKHGVCQGTTLVWLTDAAKEELLDPGYEKGRAYVSIETAV
jgi:DNA-binding MarR family transcriptional regulator